MKTLRHHRIFHSFRVSQKRASTFPSLPFLLFLSFLPFSSLLHAAAPALHYAISETGALASLAVGDESLSFTATGGGFSARDVVANKTIDLPRCTLTKSGDKIIFKSASAASDGITLQADFTPAPNNAGYLQVTGWIENTNNHTAGDRAIILDYRVCLPGDDLVFSHRMNDSENIILSKTKGETEANAFPLAALGSPGKTAVSMAIPWDEPRTFGVAAAGNALIMRFYLGLSPLPRAFPNKAPFSFIIYPSRADWGFRGSLEKYYRFYPDRYEPKRTDAGFYMYMVKGYVPDGVEQYSCSVSEIQNPHFKQDLDRNEKYNIDSLVYTIVGQREIKFLPKVPSNYNEAMRAFANWKLENQKSHPITKENSASEGDIWLREEVENSAIKDSNGKYVLELRRTNWGKNSVTFKMNPSPWLYDDQPSKRTVGKDSFSTIDKWLAAYPQIRGVIVDSLGAKWPAAANYSKEQMPYVRYPLTFDSQGRLFIHNATSHYEWVRAMHDKLAAQGRLTSANGIYSYPATATEHYRASAAGGKRRIEVGRFFITSLLDTSACESGASATVERCQGLRLMTGRKYYGLTNYAWLDKTKVEHFYNRALAYDLFATNTNVMEGNGEYEENVNEGLGYADNPNGYYRDKALLDWFLPKARMLFKAGWEPVTHARKLVGGDHVYIERYGNAGKIYFTVFNDSKTEAAFAMKLDLRSLGFAEGTADFQELAQNAKLDIVGNDEVHLKLAPYKTCIISMSKTRPRSASLRTHDLLDADWRFHLGEVPSLDAAISPDYEETNWQKIQLPHDYGLDMPYNPDSPKGRGYLAPEIGWYRKHFTIPKTDAGKTLQLEFGGIFRDSKIWLNGQLVATHASGYTSFFVDITRAARPGADNLLVVRVDPTKPEGWWYEGSGIYRHVYYNATSPLHVANYGTYVTATVPDGDKGSAAEAELTIQTTLQNDTPAPATCEVLSEILAPDGTLVATLKTNLSLNGKNRHTLTQTTTIPSPRLWSLETPNLYQLRTTIIRGNPKSQNPSTSLRVARQSQKNPKFQIPKSKNKPQAFARQPPIAPRSDGASAPPVGIWNFVVWNLFGIWDFGIWDFHAVDTTSTTFGIRTIRFDPDTGFTLNGKPVKIQGAAVHTDMPAVGIAVPDSLQEWRVRKLQEMGCNAWRMAHNPPSEALLDACDRLGMLVKAENRHLGNVYGLAERPNPDDTEFPDLTDMIQRDRNHPSIILWSLSNEGVDQDTPNGERVWRAMQTAVHRYDKTRPLTSATNRGWLTKHGLANVAEIIGVNYNTDKYDAIRRAHPGKPIFASETANIKTTRGEYANDPATGYVSNYNMLLPGETKNPNYGTPLATTGWPPVAARAWMFGYFKWTAFDYKGEPNPYNWPNISNNTGLMDVCGFPKDQYYYQKSCWTTAPMVHLMPMTWNHPAAPAAPDAAPIRVVAFSNAQEVELLLNDRSLGRKPIAKNSWAEWQVPYAPGTLLARAYSADGALVATDKQETTGAPALLRLTPDRQTLVAATQDTLIVPLSIHDAEGRVVPDATNRITFHLTGGGNARILGAANGNPSDHDPDRAPERNAFHGYAIVLIQAGDHPGPLELTATSPGLAPATITLTVTPAPCPAVPRPPSESGVQSPESHCLFPTPR